MEKEKYLAKNWADDLLFQYLRQLKTSQIRLINLEDVSLAEFESSSFIKPRAAFFIIGLPLLKLILGVNPDADPKATVLLLLKKASFASALERILIADSQVFPARAVLVQMLSPAEKQGAMYKIKWCLKSQGLGETTDVKDCFQMLEPVLSDKAKNQVRKYCSTIVLFFKWVPYWPRYAPLPTLVSRTRKTGTKPHWPPSRAHRSFCSSLQRKSAKKS